MTEADVLPHPQKSTLPGSLMEIHGCGVLLNGPSGIGKSDTILGLIDRGHRLVADDAIEVTISNNELIGSCPRPLWGMVSVRGLGIIDIAGIYGERCLIETAHIDLNIELESGIGHPFTGKRDRRLLLGISVPWLKLPVTGGRNIPLLIEVAVRDHQLRTQNYRADEAFATRQWQC
jgi:HPr kinase/phosphorylase